MGCFQLLILNALLPGHSEHRLEARLGSSAAEHWPSTPAGEACVLSDIVELCRLALHHCPDSWPALLSVGGDSEAGACSLLILGLFIFESGFNERGERCSSLWLTPQWLQWPGLSQPDRSQVLQPVSRVGGRGPGTGALFCRWQDQNCSLWEMNLLPYGMSALQAVALPAAPQCPSCPN